MVPFKKITQQNFIWLLLFNTVSKIIWVTTTKGHNVSQFNDAIIFIVLASQQANARHASATKQKLTIATIVLRTLNSSSSSFWVASDAVPTASTASTGFSTTKTGLEVVGLFVGASVLGALVGGGPIGVPVGLAVITAELSGGTAAR